MATIAISAAISVGVGFLSAALSPKPKQPRVERGRADDIRIMTSDEGTFIPRFKGWGRAAPNIIWNTPIIEHKHTTTVDGGGKGLGGGGAHEEVDYTYTTTLCCAIAAGPMWNGLRRIWRNSEVIYNTAGAGNGGYYEGEDASNTFGGVTQVNTYDSASGRKEITLGHAGTVQFNNVLSYGAQTRPLTIYFRTGALTAYKLYVNNVLIETGTFPNTGNSVFQTRTVEAAFNNGMNTVKIENTDSAFNLGIDRIFLFPGFDTDAPVTGVVSTKDFATVAPDPTNPKAFFNSLPDIDPGGGDGDGGSGGGTLSDGSGTQIFFYLGTENQLQDATMVAADGAENVPAYKEIFIVVLKDLQLPNNQLPNLTFEFDEGTHDLAQAIKSYYLEVGAKESEIDTTDLAGIHFIGQVVEKLQPLEDTLEPLQQWYNFDLLPIDGKIKAVKRGGTIKATIPESKLGAYEEGGDIPTGPVGIDYIDPLAVAREINIGFLNVARDYKNSTEPVARAVGLNTSVETLNFPVIAETPDAVQVGLRILFAGYIERPIQFSTGMEFFYLSPTDPVQINLANISYRVRVTNRQATPGGGIVKWRGVTEDAGVYNQTIAPAPNGFEALLVDFPANSILILIDAPLIRPEDAGDGTAPVVLMASCKQGNSRPWRGDVIFKEILPDEYERVTNFDMNCAIGVPRSALANYTGDLDSFDNTHTLTVDFWNEEDFESYTELEINTQPAVNLFWLGVNGGDGEYLQAATVTPTTPLAGYKRAFIFSDWLRGKFDTSFAIPLHGTGEYLVYLDSRIKPRTMPRTDIGQPFNYVAASIGQGINEAKTVAEIAFTLQGNSLRPSPINDLTLERIINDLVVTWREGDDLLNEKFILRIIDGGVVIREQTIDLPDAVPANWAYLDGSDALQVTTHADGTIECIGPNLINYQSQIFSGDVSIEWEVDDRCMGVIGLMPLPGADPIGVFVTSDKLRGSSGDIDYIFADNTGGVLNLRKRLAPRSIIRIDVRNKQAEYYFNNKFWLRGYSTAVPNSFRLFASFLVNIFEDQAMLKVRVRPYSVRQFVYTRNMQLTDFPGGVPATVTVQVVAVSDLGLESKPVQKVG